MLCCDWVWREVCCEGCVGDITGVSVWLVTSPVDW